MYIFELFKILAPCAGLSGNEEDQVKTCLSCSGKFLKPVSTFLERALGAGLNAEEELPYITFHKTVGPLFTKASANRMERSGAADPKVTIHNGRMV